MPLSDDVIEKTKLWVRRAEIPKQLVHFTPTKNVSEILNLGYIKPRVSAVGEGDIRAIGQLKKIMPISWELHTPIFIPTTENYKFKRVLYPYSLSSIIDEMLALGELELVNEMVFKEYGPVLWQYTQKVYYVEEKELVSIEPVMLR